MTGSDEGGDDGTGTTASTGAAVTGGAGGWGASGGSGGSGGGRSSPRNRSRNPRKASISDAIAAPMSADGRADLRTAAPISDAARGAAGAGSGGGVASTAPA